ncbi:MAG TPA: hypothetical protein VF390_01370 [Patescibacteria group bacterium]
MREAEKPKMVTCPECFEEIPATDIHARGKHMKRHPQVIVWELDKLGYHQAADRVLREIKQANGGRKIK